MAERDDPDLRALLARFVAAIETGDGAALADCFTEDGVYDDYFFGPRRGRAGIVETLEHFYRGGGEFRWVFTETLSSPNLAFAPYRFSYRSRTEGAGTDRVLFAGVARLELRDGLIAVYSEVFDRGMALAQQAFAPERIALICRRYAHALRVRPEWAEHLTPTSACQRPSV